MDQPFSGFISCLDWEDALAREIEWLFPGTKAGKKFPGLVACTGNSKALTINPVFARQWLPNCHEVKGSSIRNLIEGVGKILDPVLDNSGLPWTFKACTPDAFTQDGEKYLQVKSRLDLLEENFLERMNTYRRRAMDRFRPCEMSDPGFPSAPSKRPRAALSFPGIIVQMVIVEAGTLWLSISETLKIRDGIALPLIWYNNPGLAAHDDFAPCRSYYKIEEAWLKCGISPVPGETCVDLGAAPGGWTWAALKRGAKVIAIDAADLNRRVADHPQCEHLRENGYSYLPSGKVDWMFCDMIVKPMATIGLLERWLEAGICRKFVVNVKFRGKDPSSILISISELNAKWNFKKLSVRHLFHDRNEITLVGLV